MGYFTMADLVRKVRVPRHRITYALERGFIPEPAKIQNRRMFTEEDVRIIRTYFIKKEVENG